MLKTLFLSFDEIINMFMLRLFCNAVKTLPVYAYMQHTLTKSVYFTCIYCYAKWRLIWRGICDVIRGKAKKIFLTLSLDTDVN